jgi:hypothetical protein
MRTAGVFAAGILFACRLSAGRANRKTQGKAENETHCSTDGQGFRTFSVLASSPSILISAPASIPSSPSPQFRAGIFCCGATGHRGARCRGVRRAAPRARRSAGKHAARLVRTLPFVHGVLREYAGQRVVSQPATPADKPTVLYQVRPKSAPRCRSHNRSSKINQAPWYILKTKSENCDRAGATLK